MRNIQLVTAHLADKAALAERDPQREILRFLPTYSDGTLLHTEDDGTARRMSQCQLFLQILKGGTFLCRLFFIVLRILRSIYA